MAEPFPTDYFVAWHPARPGGRLDDEIRRRVPALGRERLKEAFAGDRVTRSGRPADPGAAVDPPSRIEVTVTDEDAGRHRATGRAGDGFFLLYRDDDLLLVDKEAGVLTVPTDEAARAGSGTSGERTLVERVAAAAGHKVIPVHRLDRFTSGILVMARHPAARARLVRQFAEHSIVRRYWAFTRGVPTPRAGTFRSFLVSDRRRVQRVVAAGRGGELAITHYEVVETLGEIAVVQVALETGRRNQIRVQFAEAGWPLVGEHRYGAAKDETFARQALHAAELELRHPRDGSPLSAASPLPEDMRRFLERARRRAQRGEESGKLKMENGKPANGK